MSHSCEQSHLQIALSQLITNSSTISIGKYGSFKANHIIGRPYHLTFEILDTSHSDTPTPSSLRVVPAAELYSDIKDDDPPTPLDAEAGTSSLNKDGVEYEIVGQNGEVVMRTNRQIIDDPNSQIMTMDEIEAMKAQSTGSGKDLIAKILESHSALDQKTAFALAKYTLRKTKKYLKRFTVLPLDVSTLVSWMFTEKEPMKILELRGEIMALIGSWSNVRCTPLDPIPQMNEDIVGTERGRWLVIDETAGLLVACIAEKMGILYPPEEDDDAAEIELPLKQDNSVNREQTDADSQPMDSTRTTQYYPHPHKSPNPATKNTITLLHANAQPNLSLLKYFHFDAFTPSPSHPLSENLKSLSWLQLLAPEDDMGYIEPSLVSEEELRSWKSGKRSNYFRKRRRWERIKFIVDETRSGGFDGLIVASVMSPVTILRHTVPLLRGAAQVVVYSPTVEPLVELGDLYSSGRRTAFVTNPPDPESMPTEDFPLNPTLLLAPTIHTARCRSWQVLPGRTHPLMTGRGGSEGYVFVATRVLPAGGKVEARGRFKRRKVDSGATVTSSQGGTPAVVEGGSVVEEGV